MGPALLERVVRRPPRALEGVVDRVSGFARAGGPPGVHAVRESAHVKLIVGLGEPFDYCTMADEEQRPRGFRVFLAGPHLRPAGVRHDGGQTAVEVEIQPMWAMALFSTSAAELGASIVDLDQVVGHSGRVFADEVLACRSWEGRLDAVTRFLVRRREANSPPAMDVAWAWREIRRLGGDIRVPDLAEAAGWSDRHFRRRFRLQTGLGPKAAARIARLGRAEHLMSKGRTGA